MQMATFFWPGSVFYIFILLCASHLNHLGQQAWISHHSDSKDAFDTFRQTVIKISQIPFSSYSQNKRKMSVSNSGWLTRAQRRSTASRMSSWCPILVTPSSSSSWWVMCSSCSPPICSRSKLFTYCWRQSSRPEESIDTHRLAGVDAYLLPQCTNTACRTAPNTWMDFVCVWKKSPKTTYSKYWPKEIQRFKYRGLPNV